MDRKERVKMMNDMVRSMTVYNPHLRRGQEMVSILNEYRPDLSQVLVESYKEVDPFYDDSKVESFLLWLGSMLKSEEEAA